MKGEVSKYVSIGRRKFYGLSGPRREKSEEGTAIRIDFTFLREANGSRSNFLFCLIYALIHGMIGSFEADFPESTYNTIGSRTPLSAASLVRPNLNYTINLLSEN